MLMALPACQQPCRCLHLLLLLLRLLCRRVAVAPPFAWHGRMPPPWCAALVLQRQARESRGAVQQLDAWMPCSL